MICLVLALQWGGTSYDWSAPTIIGLLVTFAVLLIAFLVIEFKFPETAMAPPRIVLNRSVGSSLFFTFMSSGGIMCTVYYIAIWFQAAQGQTAKEAGIRTIPLVLSLVLFGIVVAIFTQKIGYYVPSMLVAPILAATGAGMLSTLTPSASKAQWIGYQVFYGLGIGAGAQSASLAIQTVLPREDVSLGTGLSFFMQQLGGALFLPVAQNLFSTALVKKLSGVAGLDANVILNTGATDLKNIVPANQLYTAVNAYSYATTRVFVLGAALSACMVIGALGVEWKSIKKGKPAAQGQATECLEKGESKTNN
jgi:MFS family permease